MKTLYIQVGISILALVLLFIVVIWGSYLKNEAVAKCESMGGVYIDSRTTQPQCVKKSGTMNID